MASEDKRGLLEDAHNETLFLDEIGDLDVDNQRLLLKAIEEKKFLPIGGKARDLRTSDFRLICATNLNEDHLSQRLAPDFRDRIDNLILRLPPLREIRDELTWLWESAFQEAATRAGVGQQHLKFAESHHERVIEQLRKHPLPGNMRDLFRVAYRIVAARGDAHDPLSPADAVKYGLAALAEAAAPAVDTTSRAVARAFADSRPIDRILSVAGRIETKALEHDLQAFVATEIRRIAKATSRPVEELCDVTARSLFDWAKSQEDGVDFPKAGSSAPKTKNRRALKATT